MEGKSHVWYVWNVIIHRVIFTGEYAPVAKSLKVVADSLQAVINKVDTDYIIVSAVREDEVML